MLLMEWIGIAVLIALDQVTKYLIASNPAGFLNKEIIPGFFYLTYVKNTVTAWSILSGQTMILSLVSAVAVLAMLWALEKTRKEGKKLLFSALVLMTAGAAGNLIDRLLLGFVRDFLNFYIFGYDFPVFNVADICLCVGVGLLILHTILEPDSKETD